MSNQERKVDVVFASTGRGLETVMLCAPKENEDIDPNNYSSTYKKKRPPSTPLRFHLESPAYACVDRLLYIGTGDNCQHIHLQATKQPQRAYVRFTGHGILASTEWRGSVYCVVRQEAQQVLSNCEKHRMFLGPLRVQLTVVESGYSPLLAP